MNARLRLAAIATALGLTLAITPAIAAHQPALQDRLPAVAAVVDAQLPDSAAYRTSSKYDNDRCNRGGSCGRIRNVGKTDISVVCGATTRTLKPGVLSSDLTNCKDLNAIKVPARKKIEITGVITGKRYTGEVTVYVADTDSGTAVLSNA